VGALLVGVIAVGLWVGVVVGRSTERVRRGFKDLSTARATATKGRQIAFAELRKALGVFLLTAVVFVALFLGAMHSHS
jgi:hypothetical protein